MVETTKTFGDGYTAGYKSACRRAMDLLADYRDNKDFKEDGWLDAFRNGLEYAIDVLTEMEATAK